jgi:hypothetical protein
MRKATIRRGVGVRSGAMIEGLEGRTMLSISPAAAVLPATFGKVTPATIQPFKTGTQPVTLHNTGKTLLSETVTIGLTPSLDGKTAAGAYTSPTFSEPVNIKPHGSVTVRVPFTPPSTGLSSGKYRNLIDVTFVNGPVASETGVSPGTFTYKAPPGPTVTPSLIGEYTGKINVTATTGGGGSLTHILGVIWDITSQTLSNVTGTITIGLPPAESGTFTGFETTTGTFNFTFASADGKMTFTWSSGKVLKNGAELTAKSVGTLSPANLFPHMNGTLKLFKS